MKHKVKITVVIIHNNHKLYCIMIEKIDYPRNLNHCGKYPRANYGYFDK